MLKTIFLTIFAIVLATAAAVAQPRSSNVSRNAKKTVRSADNFVSVEGGFAIDLPARVSGYEPNERVEGVLLGGSKFTWNIPRGFFMVSFFERAAVPANHKALLEGIARTFIDDIAGKGDRLLGKKEISIDDHPGLEIRARLKKGAIGVARYYSVGNRTFFVTTGWNPGENGALQLKILDSFRLIDKAATLAKMVDEATPKPLPQTPPVAKAKSDAAEDGLKGNVKSAVVTDEDLSGTWSVGGIKKSSEADYDPNGFRTRYVSYDYKGLPMSIAVYGFIDGMRVSSAGDLRYEYDPPIMVMQQPAAVKAKTPVKPFDPRYEARYEYKYNDNGQLIEEARFLSNGELLSKTVYVYDGNKAEISTLGKDGKVYSKSIEIRDENSNLVEKTHVSTDPKTPDSKYQYSYAGVDEKGNWTKRIVFGKDGNPDGTFKQQHYIEYQTITYY